MIVEMHLGGLLALSIGAGLLFVGTIVFFSLYCAKCSSAYNQKCDLERKIKNLNIDLSHCRNRLAEVKEERDEIEADIESIKRLLKLKDEDDD